MLGYRRKSTVKIWFTVYRQKRYRQKRENRLPTKRYRHVALPSRPSPSKMSLPNTSLIFSFTSNCIFPHTPTTTNYWGRWWYILNIISTPQPLHLFPEHVCRRQPARLLSSIYIYVSYVVCLVLFYFDQLNLNFNTVSCMFQCYMDGDRFYVPLPELSSAIWLRAWPA